MKCEKCQALLPPHYNRCPVCGYNKFSREQFVQQPQEEEVPETMSALVVDGDIDDMGM
jgi:predicted amidophosphoribosyltransferase